MSLPRLPTKDDFPSRGDLQFDIVPPSTTTKVPINILILLHGLGDSKNSFTLLARNLNLPETACLSLQGLLPVPDIFTGGETPSFHWGADILFDSSTGKVHPDARFEKTIETVHKDIIKPLVSKCGFPPRNILFLGFGQGGMAALAIACGHTEEYGGVVSIGGPLPSSIASTVTSNMKAKTPILVCGGNRSTSITRTAIDRLKERFQTVEYASWEREGDGMMRNKEEMLPVMRFFARRLRSNLGKMEGAVELS